MALLLSAKASSPSRGHPRIHRILPRSKLVISIGDITNLQQTPATAKSIALKVVVLAVNHVFNFTSTSAARLEQTAITDALREAIQAATAANGLNEEGQSSAAATPAAPTASSSAKAAESWYNDQALKVNVELQQSLLKKDPTLRQRFEEALREKPEGITNAQFSLQFWSARVHLLRAHAIERAQTQGAYNVLSELKPKNVDGETRLNLGREKIQLIFNQHPLVKHVYNEVVPKLSETDFWERFFKGRLFKKLKGERITDDDPTDAVLDKYLSMDEFSIARNNKQNEAHVPHFIDLEGNEQNHSQRKGNAPDFTMRPNASEKVPILRALNNMSEKMMANVAPADGDPHGPAGMDEETYAQLRLRDLQADEQDDRVVLKIKDQNHLFSSRNGSNNNDDDDKKRTAASIEAQIYAKQDPEKVITTLREGFNAGTKSSSGRRTIDLASAIGFHEDDSDSDSDGDDDDDAADAMDTSVKTSPAGAAPSPHKRIRVGSRAALRSASAQMTDLIAQQRTHLAPSSSSVDIPSALPSSSSSAVPLLAGSATLTPNTLATLHLTHNTTTEFLHYFWSLFLSSSSSSTTTTSTSTSASELPSLLSTLSSSLARIDAVCATADKDREARIAEVKSQMMDVARRTGRRVPMRLEEGMLGVGGGGRKEVERLMGPTVEAIGAARRAWEERIGGGGGGGAGGGGGGARKGTQKDGAAAAAAEVVMVG